MLLSLLSAALASAILLLSEWPLKESASVFAVFVRPRVSEAVEAAQGKERMLLLVENRRRLRVAEALAAGMERSSSSAPRLKPAETVLDQVGPYLPASQVGDSETFDAVIAAVKRAGGSALAFDVKGSFVFFDVESPAAHDLDLVRPRYKLTKVLDTLHGQGLQAIARYISVKDPVLASRSPDTRISNPKTGAPLSKDWVDPMNDAVLNYNMQIICELAAAGIDEINLDYIRFPTEDVRAMSVFSTDEKADRLETFIRSARATIDRCGPATRLGISTYAILGWDFDLNVQTLGQDVRRFAPLVDVISPMAYPSTFSGDGYLLKGEPGGSRFYHLVYNTLRGYQQILGWEQAKKLRPWIQAYFLQPSAVADEIRAVYDAEVCGFTLWDARTKYGHAYTAMGMVERPEKCGRAVSY